MQDDDPEIRRVVLAGMRQALPDARTEARALAGLLAQLSSPPPPAGDGGGAAIGSAALGSTLKVIVGATIVATAVLGGALVATRGPASPPTRTEPAPPITRPAPSSPAATTPSVPPAPTAVAPVVAPAPAIAPPIVDAPKPSAPRALAPESASTDGLAAETEILAAAEAALATGDPARALELAAAHAERHPNGQLALEREAIATAAACVADRPGATDAAREFVREHPRTAAAAKVRARCENLGAE